MKRFSAIINLSIILLLAVSHVNAKAPDIVLEQKNAVVTIFVGDKNKRHIVAGSGFIVDQNGIIATNCNVIVKWLEELENTLRVEMKGGIHFPIEDLISPKCEDNLALIKIKATGLPAVKLTANYKPKRGERIFVIGSGTTIAEGIIKGIHGKDKLIQISVPVTPEESGSPIFNIKGEAIGAAISLPQKGKNLNFAVPLKGIAKQLDPQGFRDRRLEKQSAKIDTPSHLPTKPSAESKIKHDKAGEEAEKHPENAVEYFLVGCAYDELKKYKEAIEAYRQSLKIKPDFAEAYVNLGVAFYKLGRYADAVDAYKKAIQIKPDSPSIYNKLGAAYIISGSYSMALDTFNKAIGLDPKDAVAHFNLGIVYFLNGEKKAAFREYTILKDLDKERANSLKDLMY